MPLAPGATLGAYRIAGPLGAGGMGEVYRARDTRLDRDVAIKVLPPDVAGDPTRLERFSREARTIAALNHPHIVTIFSTEEADGVRFLTMELVEGQTLDALLGGGGLSVGRFLELALPLADALTAAHQKQITHRDLKPGNVMLSADGRLKVLDFGLARIAAEGQDQAVDATRAALTGEGTIVGTMPYMSPEQVEGRPLDPRSDLFSLGVMFFEMLTGARRFQGPSSPALMSAILRDTPPLASDGRADVPEALARLVARCLEKRPEDRVQTARDVYNELRHVQRQAEAGAAAARPASGSGRASTDLRVAVLPFAHRGAEPAAGLADGLTEDVTTGLSRFAHLRVVPAGTAATLTPESAQRAGVRYLLEGRVQSSGSTVRVTVRLIDGATGSNLWAQTFDRAVGTTAFEVQDDVASHVVATVGDTSGVLARSMAATLLHRPVEELTVRELVLRFHAYVEHFQTDEHARLRRGFERALEHEPIVAEGWACLADLYEHEHSQQLNPLPDSLGRQRRAAQRAVEVDPHNQRGWTAMAAVHTFERDHAALRVATERAIGLNPLDADTVGLCALFLSCAGDDDRAMELFERAARLKPQHPGWYHFPPFTTHYKRQQYAEALAQAKRIALPQLPTAHLAAAAAAARMGSASEALTALEGLRRLDARFLEREAARQMWALWLWDDALVADLADGLAQARELTRDPSGSRPPSSGLSERSGSGSMPRSSPAEAAMRVAVLPFTARGGDDATALAEGLTNDLTSALARFPYLKVVARAAVHDTTGRSHDAAGAALNARFLIEGSIHQGGASVRISVRLSDRDTAAHLWADTLDRDLAAGLFAVQDDIVSHLAATVADASGVLVRSMGAAIRDLPLDGLSLDDLLLRYQLYTDQFTAADHVELYRAFEAVVAREPGAAQAWACLGMLVSAEMFFGLNPRPQSLERLREYAERATTLDSSIQYGWTATAVLAMFERDRAGLEAAAERAIAINPLHTRTLAVVGVQLAFAGQVDRGVALLERAMALNHRHPGWYLIGPFLQAYGREEYEAALRHARRIGMPKFVPGLFAAASAAGQAGSVVDARAAVEAIARIGQVLLQPAEARRHWAALLWDTAAIERLVDGFAKALSIAAVTPPASSGAARVRPGSGETPPNSIAVLPFADLSPAKDQEWFCDGIAEEILNALTGLPGLRVAARTSAFSFRGREADLRAIADALSVATVLQGSLRRAGDRVRITVQLVDTQSGFQLWSERHDRELADIFDVQDEIARGVAERLKVTLDGTGDRVAARRTGSIQAFELYLRGRALLNQRGPSLLPALEAFRQSVELDPDFALAWAGIADAYTVLGYLGALPVEQMRGRCLRAAARALALAPDSAEAHTAVACAALLYRADQDQAGRSFQQALALNPAYVQGRTWYALFYLQWTLGRMDEGILEARKAVKTDPLSPHARMMLSAALYTAGRYAEAVEEARHALTLDPRSFPPHWILTESLGRLGRFEEALDVFDRGAAVSNRHPMILLPQSQVLAALGRKADADAVYRELVERARTTHVNDGQLAVGAWYAGHHEIAVEHVRRALDTREPVFVLAARHTPMYRDMHADPRIAAIVGELDALPPLADAD